MNLENLNLEELKAEEVQETVGGTWPGLGWWMDCGFGYGSVGDQGWPYYGAYDKTY